MRKSLFLFTSFLLISIISFAQQTITGKVTDANSIPLAGISVKSKKTGKGTATAADGTFRFTVGADDLIELTGVGYVSQTVSPVASVMNIILKNQRRN